jgi:hypothetical protein
LERFWRVFGAIGGEFYREGRAKVSHYLESFSD